GGRAGAAPGPRARAPTRNEAPRGAGEGARARPRGDGARSRRRRCARFAAGSTSVALHRGPEPVAVEPRDVVLGLLARPAGDDRLALVVDLEHQLRRLRL